MLYASRASRLGIGSFLILLSLHFASSSRPTWSGTGESSDAPVAVDVPLPFEVTQPLGYVLAASEDPTVYYRFSGGKLRAKAFDARLVGSDLCQMMELPSTILAEQPLDAADPRGQHGFCSIRAGQKLFRKGVRLLSDVSLWPETADPSSALDDLEKIYDSLVDRETQSRVAYAQFLLTATALLQFKDAHESPSTEPPAASPVAAIQRYVTEFDVAVDPRTWKLTKYDGAQVEERLIPFLEEEIHRLAARMLRRSLLAKEETFRKLMAENPHSELFFGAAKAKAWIEDDKLCDVDLPARPTSRTHPDSFDRLVRAAAGRYLKLEVSLLVSNYPEKPSTGEGFGYDSLLEEDYARALSTLSPLVLPLLKDPEGSSVAIVDVWRAETNSRRIHWGSLWARWVNAEWAQEIDEAINRQCM